MASSNAASWASVATEQGASRALSTRRDTVVRVPKKGQCLDLLKAFQRGERLTVAIALEEYQIYALSQRCGELKRLGWPILSEMRTVKSGKRIAVYWMDRYVDELSGERDEYPLREASFL